MITSTISTPAEARLYINALRDELIAVYMKAYSTSFKSSMSDSTYYIAQTLSDFIIHRPDWKQGEKPGSFTYQGKHTFFLEPILFSAKGLGWMPIETAKHIVRWELENLVQLDNEKFKTTLITDAVNYIEQAGWKYPFMRWRM